MLSTKCCVRHVKTNNGLYSAASVHKHMPLIDSVFCPDADLVGGDPQSSFTASLRTAAHSPVRRAASSRPASASTTLQFRDSQSNRQSRGDVSAQLTRGRTDGGGGGGGRTVIAFGTTISRDVTSQRGRLQPPPTMNSSSNHHNNISSPVAADVGAVAVAPATASLYSERFDADSPYGPLYVAGAHTAPVSPQARAMRQRRRRPERNTGSSSSSRAEGGGGGDQATTVRKLSFWGGEGDQAVRPRNDLSIFRAPRSKGARAAGKGTSKVETNQHRFIGLTWQESEYVKQRHRVEGARRPDNAP
jgi:hypothetical protein